MNACAVKPKLPFVATKKLKRTPASKENREMVKFMDSHNFSFTISDTKELKTKITRK